MSSKIVFFVATFFALSLAAPFPAPKHQECPPGTWWSDCQNLGVSGCFNYDRCNEYYTPSPTVSISTKTATPHTTSTSTPTAQSGIIRGRHYNIYVDSARSAESLNHGTDSPPHLDVVADLTGKQITQQVAVFEGIPAGAKSCSLGWFQSSIADRGDGAIFEVDGNGLVSTRQLASEGFPDKNATHINSITIEPFTKVAGPWSPGMDFTFWPEYQGPRVHMGGSLNCSETIVMQFAVNMLEPQMGRVTISNNELNGVYVSYAL